MEFRSLNATIMHFIELGKANVYKNVNKRSAVRERKKVRLLR